MSIRLRVNGTVIDSIEQVAIEGDGVTAAISRAFLLDQYGHEVVTAEEVVLTLEASGGGSLPPEWSIGPQGQLTITPGEVDDGPPALTLVGFPVMVKDGSGNKQSQLGGDLTFWDAGGVTVRAYLNRKGEFWVGKSNGEPMWGSTGNNGDFPDDGPFEFFKGSSEPDNSFVSSETRIHWYDDTTDAPALRFKQKDAFGTLTEGKAAGLAADGTAFLGVSKPHLPAGPSADDISAALVALALVIQDA